MNVELIPFKIKSSEWSIDTHERSPGLHLSQIIKKIEERLNPKKFRADLDEEKLEAYRMMGFAWERVIVACVLEGVTLERPGEFSKDGIAMSPDAINIGEWSLEEWKCTWRSHKGMPFMDERNIRDLLNKEFTSWMMQAKSYLYALCMDTVIFRMMFVCGDYATNRYPTPVAIQIQFTERELQENWDMILDRAQREGMLDERQA